MKKALEVESGSGSPRSRKVGRLSDDKLIEIAKIKMKDLNTTDIEKAKRVIAGTANSMGIEIEG